ncbi:MAG: CobD/CbiB family protein [Betaproteobacteria bacterium]
MVFFSLLAVLLLEHVGPLPYRLVAHEPLSRYAQLLENCLNAGERRHGLLAWLVAVGLPVLVSLGVYAVCHAFNPLLAWVWNVLILYLAMGFRQVGQTYNDIELALRLDDLPHARGLLAEWRGLPSSDLPAPEIARLAIEEMLTVSHRHVFAVVFFFVLLPGPSGAVLYRLASVLADVWGRGESSDVERFGRFSQQALAFMEALASRVTAAGFAVAGNFEEAIYSWRTQAARWPVQIYGKGLGIVLASGSGAIGVRLGSPIAEADPQSEVGLGREADVDAMQRVTGLVLRATFLWLLLLLLLGVASLFTA